MVIQLSYSEQSINIQRLSWLYYRSQVTVLCRWGKCIKKTNRQSKGIKKKTRSERKKTTNTFLHRQSRNYARHYELWTYKIFKSPSKIMNKKLSICVNPDCLNSWRLTWNTREILYLYVSLFVLWMKRFISIVLQR